MKGLLMVALSTAVAAAACSGGSASKADPAEVLATSGPADDDAAEPPTNPHLATVATMQRKMEETCACRDAACVDQVEADYEAQLTGDARDAARADAETGKRAKTIDSEETTCRDRALASADATEAPSDSAITTRFQQARDAICKCQSKTCLGRAEKKMAAMSKRLTDEQLLALERADADRIVALGEEAKRCGAQLRAGK